MGTSERHTDKAKGGAQTGRTPLTTGAPNHEVYEQLLALVDKLGAAYSEACEQIGAAYVETYQTMAQGAVKLQGNVVDPQQSDWRSAVASPAATQEHLAEAQERAMAMGDHVSDLGLEVGLAYLDAIDQAALAAARCYEGIAALSRVDLVKSTAATRAELVRKVTEAYTATLREIVA
jgi:DNA-binding ferritin-like protein